AQIWQQRTGETQLIDVDRRHALAMFRSERYLRLNGQPPADPWSPIAGYYQAGDGRWLQLHTNFPHHSAGVTRVLNCQADRASVAQAISHWDAATLDATLAEQGLCAAMIRTYEEWRVHPQAKAIAALPLFDIEKIDEAPAVSGFGLHSAKQPERPLSHVRVLDLSRVIAAPVAARTLAQHGADVLAISAAHLPNILPLVMDTGRGKRSAELDLRDLAGREKLCDLIRNADVFLQAYRPGALAGRGFSPRELSQIRPGIICVSLSAYGHTGPWAERRGFDSLVQSATGIAYEEGVAAGLAGPGKLPCQALDHATGYLAAYATMLALHRRAHEGGSWHVRVSLAQTGHWLQSMQRRGLHDASSELTPAEIATWMDTGQSGFGTMSAIRPVEKMSATPARFAYPAAVLGSHPAAWW
ncbi:MAG: CoA transferase, partial [Burkholderiales bacterium]|nr:CoA transferase [Burkholderiales bacterium]